MILFAPMLPTQVSLTVVGVTLAHVHFTVGQDILFKAFVQLTHFKLSLIQIGQPNLIPVVVLPVTCFFFVIFLLIGSPRSNLSFLETLLKLSIALWLLSLLRSHGWSGYLMIFLFMIYNSLLFIVITSPLFNEEFLYLSRTQYSINVLSTSTSIVILLEKKCLKDSSL